MHDDNDNAENIVLVNNDNVDPNLTNIVPDDHDDNSNLDFEDLSRFNKKKDKLFFPFTGIVGQQSMKKGLILVSANPRISSLLIIGENGTGKVTASMGLQAFLPDLEVSAQCTSNCDPRNSLFLCTTCKDSGVTNDDNIIQIPTPFMVLPVGTSHERIFGSFEKDGSFVPGLISIANRGYILMERVNLHDADMIRSLLDIRDKGVCECKCEKGEFTFTHPAQFTLIATLNPSEGELDEDILKRFQLVVHTRSLKDIEERIEIVRRVESFKEDPQEFLDKSKRELDGLRAVIENSRRLLKRADIPSKSMDAIINILKSHDTDNPAMRDAMVESTKANTVINDSTWASIEDIAEIVDMVMAYHMKKEA